MEYGWSGIVNKKSYEFSIPLTEDVSASFLGRSADRNAPIRKKRGADQMSSGQLGAPPSVYCKEKKLLLNLAKVFALKHGYKLVISKNDSRRVILLCSKHGKGQPKQGSSVGIVVEDGKKDSKCDCPFKLELQFKARKDLWLLKPIADLHNHTSLIKYPVTFSGAGLHLMRIERTCSSQVGHSECSLEIIQDYFNAEESQAIHGVRVIKSKGAHETPFDREVSETLSPEEEPVSFADVDDSFQDHAPPPSDPERMKSKFRVDISRNKPKLPGNPESLGNANTSTVIMIKYSLSLELAISTLTQMARQIPKDKVHFTLSYGSQIQKDLEIVITTSGVLEMEHKINLASPDISKSLPALISMISGYQRG